MTSHSNQKFSKLIGDHVPASAQSHCIKLWLRYPFYFKVTSQRVSKLGDYRYHRGHNTHQISVNGTLNRYAFLITYLHEVAHLLAFQRYGFNIMPHGREWKACFRALMKPMLNTDTFPKGLLTLLIQHMRNPKATSGSDKKLSLALRRYDPNDGSTLLIDILPGEIFHFRKMLMAKESVRRTRAICRDVNSGKRYYISLAAPVWLAKGAKGDG